MAKMDLTDAQYSALSCFCYLAQKFRLRIAVSDLARAKSFDTSLAPSEMVRVLAPYHHLKIQSFKLTGVEWKKLHLPVMAERLGGTWTALVARSEFEFVAVDSVSGAVHRFQIDGFSDAFTGRILALKERRDMPEIHRVFGLSWLTRRANQMRGLLVQILVASLVMQIFATAMPLFSQVVIDKVLVHHNISALYVLGVGMGILTVFEFVLMLLRTQLQAHVASKVDLELGVRIKQKLLRLPMHYFQSRSSGHVLGLFKELDTVRQFITGPSATSLVDVTFLVVFLPLMLCYSPTLTGITVVTALAMMAVSFLMKPGLTRRMSEHSRAATECQSALVENLAGIGTIKALAAEPVMQRRWESAFALNVLATLRSANAQGASAAASTFIQRASTLGILWVGADLALQNRISVGQMIAFQMLSARVLHPMMRMSQLWQDLCQVQHSMSRLGDIMNAPGEETSGDRALILAPRPGSIEIADLRFAYPGSQTPVLRNLSVHIPFGQTVALVGRSGSGKSTLVKLLLRLHIAEQGRIRYGDVDIRNIDLSALRRRVALVPQDTELFNGTIAQNIAIHSPWASLERIAEVARAAVADVFIAELKEGYQTLVGSAGVQLSGGQRQRIALARALLHEPDVLILDEATSAIDYATELQIHDNLSRLLKGRTLIHITHRLRSIRHVDMVHVLAGGHLSESGTHAELMERGGSYRALYGQVEETVLAAVA